MTDVAYICHNCGSVHEVESIRQNLILDLRPAASYELSGNPGTLHPGVHFHRLRLSRGLAQALWPAYSHNPCAVWRRRLDQQPVAPVPGRLVSSRMEASDGDPCGCNPDLANTGDQPASINVDTAATMYRTRS